MGNGKMRNERQGRDILIATQTSIILIHHITTFPVGFQRFRVGNNIEKQICLSIQCNSFNPILGLKEKQLH